MNRASIGRQTGRRAFAALIAVLICGIGLLLLGEPAAAASKPGPVALTGVTHSGSSLTVKWKAVEGCTGYQIQYSDNRLFHGKKSKTIGKADAVTRTFKSVSETDPYYVRIRAVNTDADGTAYSAWTYSANTVKSKNVKVKPIYKNKLLKKKLELRALAKQKVPGYDTLQGACYGNGYVYYLLEDRTKANYSSSGGLKARCKIVKIKLSNKSVIKISKALPLGHGNDMTYDTKRNRLVISHSTPTPKYVSIVDPNTLKRRSTQSVELPKTLKGMSSSRRKYYNGFGNIAYNAKHDKYVVVLRGQTFHHIMLLNGDFKPVKFLPVDTMAKQMLQGIETYDDFILVGQSYGYGYTGNNILVYNWNGAYMSRLNLGNTYEMESIFHDSSGFYIGYYTSYYKYKIGKGNVLHRDNFIYKMTGF